MWLLVFLCTSTVGAVPLNSPEKASSQVTVPLNDTQNATRPVAGMFPVVIDPPQQASAETVEELQDNLIVQEGDILIAKTGFISYWSVQEDRNAVKTLWPDATVPYTISQELANREQDILSAFKMISDVTCIRFKPHDGEFNYLKLLNGDGCASFVGCQGGSQPLYFSQACSVGNLCHEVVHALGLHHEHTRKDRDRFVTVKWQNIMPARKKNFKVKHGDTLNLPYDLDSIMHYGQYFFSKDGSPTVLPVRGGDQMGQRMHLSRLDIQKLNRIYHCDERRKEQDQLG